MGASQLRTLFSALMCAALAATAGLSISCGAAAKNTQSTKGGSSADQTAPSPTATMEGQQKVDQGKSFRSGVELLGIKFLIESPNTAVGNHVTVTPSGLQVSNDPFNSPINGEVIDAQVGDLNTDSSPEVYVFVRERDGKQRVNVIGYATNSRKSMSEFVLPDPDLQRKEFLGYNGADQFEVVENTLSRRFPLFEQLGAEMKATGKTRIVQYKIKPGEATWQFYVTRFDDF